MGCPHLWNPPFIVGMIYGTLIPYLCELEGKHQKWRSSNSTWFEQYKIWGVSSSSWKNPQVRWLVYFIENPHLKWMMNRGTPMTSWKPPYAGCNLVVPNATQDEQAVDAAISPNVDMSRHTGPPQQADASHFNQTWLKSENASSDLICFQLFSCSSGHLLVIT